MWTLITSEWTRLWSAFCFLCFKNQFSLTSIIDNVQFSVLSHEQKSIIENFPLTTSFLCVCAVKRTCVFVCVLLLFICLPPFLYLFGIFFPKKENLKKNAKCSKVQDAFSMKEGITNQFKHSVTTLSYYSGPLIRRYSLVLKQISPFAAISLAQPPLFLNDATDSSILYCGSKT